MLQEILNRSDVQAIIAWGEEAIQQALELDEYEITPAMSDIEMNAASPTAWVGTLQFKMLVKLGLTDNQLDLLLENI